MFDNKCGWWLIGISLFITLGGVLGIYVDYSKVDDFLFFMAVWCGVCGWIIVYFNLFVNK